MMYPRYWLYVFAISASVILSIWCAYSETVINPDGICYLLSAQAMADTSIKQVMPLCPQSGWPFYSLLIYALAKITPVSYTVSAYTVNGFFSALSIVAFILICKEMGAKGKVLWLAALTILLPHDFNGLRQSIIRDHGYWACYLWSMWFLLRFMQKPQWNTAALWLLSLIVATLFRIEGLVFIIAAPLCCWFALELPLRQRALYYLRLSLLPILLALIIGGWILLQPHANHGRLADFSNQWQNGLNIVVERYLRLKTALAQTALTSASKGDITLVATMVMLIWYLVNIVNNLSWIFAILIAYAWIVKRPRNPVLLTYIIINLAITFIFQLEHEFLSKRYVMALSLTCMLWVPFALDYLWQRHRYLLALATFSIFISSLGGIFEFGYPKTFIHTAGDWMSVNVPPSANVYANDYQLMYYSQHFGRDIFARIHEYTHIETIAEGKWKQFDYLALRLSKTDAEKVNAIVKDITIKPMQVFQNKRGDYVAIYKVR